MKIEINVQKKHMYFLVGFIIILTGIVLVKSYDPAQGWHPANQIDFSQGLIIQQNGAVVKAGGDPNPYMELRGTGVPYIDFINDASTDYDARLILTNDNTLEVQGAGLRVSEPGSGSTLKIGTVGLGTGINAETGDLYLDSQGGLVRIGNGRPENGLRVEGSVYVQNNLRLQSLATLPTCNAGYAGFMAYSGEGITGHFYGCKKTSGSYAWAQLD